MDKLAIINSIEVVDSQACNGELEYVYAENSPENIEKLRQIGVEGVIESEDGMIDLAIYAFAEGMAQWFEPSLGFVDYVPNHAPDWCKQSFN